MHSHMSGAQLKLNNKLLVVQLAQATKDMEAAMAGEAQVRRDQEAEREKVKRAITDLRRKLDRWVQLLGGIRSSNCMAGCQAKRGPPAGTFVASTTAPASSSQVLRLGARGFLM